MEPPLSLPSLSGGPGLRVSRERGLAGVQIGRPGGDLSLESPARTEGFSPAPAAGLASVRVCVL